MKFGRKYRIDSARAKFWDYSWSGSYFVTICTRDRQCFFGEVVDGGMQHTGLGDIARKFWMEMAGRSFL